jgi:hypothetical protein
VTPSTLLVTDDGLPRGVSGADPRFANAIKVFVQLFSAPVRWGIPDTAVSGDD